MRMAKQLINIPSEINVVYGQIMLFNNNGGKLYPIGESWQKIKEKFKQVMCIPHLGAMHRSGLFEKIGKFDETFRIAGDYELLLRELKKGGSTFIPDFIIAGMRQGDISSAPTNALKAMSEIRLAQRMHGQTFPRILWLLSMVKFYIRLLLWRFLDEKLAKKSRFW